MTEDQALTVITYLSYLDYKFMLLHQMVNYIPMLFGFLSGSIAGLAFWNVAKGMTK